MWKWLKEYEDEEPKEWNNIVSKMTGKALDIYTSTCNGDTCDVEVYSSAKQDEDFMWKLDGNRIVSKYSSYNVLAAKDGKLVVLKPGSETNLSVQDASPQQNRSNFVFDKTCPQPPPPFEGIAEQGTSKKC